MIDYNWFFSSLVQALAAMIGVIGMFAVYRLEAEGQKIRGILLNIRNFVKKYNNIDYDLIDDSLVPAAKEIIKNLPSWASAEDVVAARKVVDRTGAGRNIDDLEKAKDTKEKLSKQAFNLISILSLVFGCSVLGLIYAKELTVNELKPIYINTLIKGFYFLSAILIFLVVVIVRLVFFCKTCFGVK